MTKKLLAAAIAGAIAAPLTAQAVDLNVSGHVHRAIRFVDTGDISDIQHVDDVSSRSRLRVRGSEDLGNGMKAGVYIEFGVASNNSDLLDAKDDNGGDRFGADIRHSALWFEGSWGAVWMGQTSTASDGVATVDMLTGLSDEVEWVADDVASVSWRIDEMDVGIDLGDTFYSADGGRRDTLRYDSPKFGPARLQVAVGQNEFWDVSLKASGSLGGGQYEAGIGYSSDGDTTCMGLASAFGITDGDSGCEQIGLSAGYQFSQGTAISGSYSTGEADQLAAANSDAEADNWFVKLGHQFGNNAVSISYGQSEYDLRLAGVSSDSEMSFYGIGFEHDIKKAGVTLTAAYHRASLDLDSNAQAALGVTEDPDDVDIVMVGAIVRFQ